MLIVKRRDHCRPGALFGALVLIALACPLDALAIEDRADTEPNAPVPEGRHVAWKLTASRHLETGEPGAHDINLRANDDDEVWWVGHYRRGAAFEQARVGYERQFRLPLGRLIASGQIASGGFLGGSVTWEISRSPDDPAFGLLGLGRTNTRSYVNLNFDPNDSTLIGAGWRIDPQTAVTLYQVRDDRLDTAQRVTHLTFRRQRSGASLTVDAFRRSGRADPESEIIRATGLSLTVELPFGFVRLVRDPKANFSRSDMTRLSIGTRF